MFLQAWVCRQNHTIWQKISEYKCYRQHSKHSLRPSWSLDRSFKLDCDNLTYILIHSHKALLRHSQPAILHKLCYPSHFFFAWQKAIFAFALLIALRLWLLNCSKLLNVRIGKRTQFTSRLKFRGKIKKEKENSSLKLNKVQL